MGVQIHDRRQTRWLGIGSIETVSLEEARDKARLLRAKVHRKPEDGGPVDVLAERRAAKQAQAQERRVEKAKAMTFKACAEGYLRANADSWKNAKHRQQWFNTLATYVYPVIGNLPVQRADESGIVKALMPIWHEKAETRRVRMRIETVIEWAIASKFYVGDNPARRDRLKHLLGAQTDVVKHHRSLHYEQIGDFTAALRRHDGIGVLPLEFCILTATRTSETLLTDWTEIDLSKRVWTIPGPRRKGKKGEPDDLAIPLSDRAVAILKETMDRTGGVGLVFPNHKGRRLSENTMLVTAKALGQEITTHGFRSTFRDWAGDETNFPREICEAALGHKVGNDVELAYRRGSALEKRRQLMQAWARYCGTPSTGKGNNVVAIGGA